jgi:hypothetical protein
MSWRSGFDWGGAASGCAWADTPKTMAATIKAMGFVSLEIFIECRAAADWLDNPRKSFCQYTTLPGPVFNPISFSSSRKKVSGKNQMTLLRHKMQRFSVRYPRPGHAAYSRFRIRSMSFSLRRRTEDCTDEATPGKAWKHRRCRNSLTVIPAGK